MPMRDDSLMRFTRRVHRRLVMVRAVERSGVCAGVASIFACLFAGIALVQGRAPLLLEVKVGDDIWRWIPALRRSLKAYDGALGVMSFDPRIPRLLKTNLPQVRRGLVVSK